MLDTFAVCFPVYSLCLLFIIYLLPFLCYFLIYPVRKGFFPREQMKLKLHHSFMTYLLPFYIILTYFLYTLYFHIAIYFYLIKRLFPREQIRLKLYHIYLWHFYCHFMWFLFSYYDLHNKEILSPWTNKLKIKIKIVPFVYDTFTVILYHFYIFSYHDIFI